MTAPECATAADADLPGLSVVVIGRNEGDRLVRCLESVRAADYPTERLEVLYVDTQSTDGSPERAQAWADRVIALTPERPCAAVGRNAGFRAARHELIQFVDGDTVMHPAWLRAGVAALHDPQVAGVFGRVEEMAPEATVYNFWAHHDWYVPPGPAEFCGGIALFRRDVLRRAGGFDETLIAGEEPDLCLRIRGAQGLTLLALDVPMVRHDMNMTRFGQYWRRRVRTGHAYAEVGRRYPAFRSWRSGRWRNLAHATALPAALVLSLAFWSAWPLALYVVLASLLVLRNARRLRGRVGSWDGALLYALHHYLGKVPMAWGQCTYWLRAALRREPQGLIEHRG